MARREFLTMEESAATLGVSVRHARRLADSGAIDRVAHGLVDRFSVDRYLSSQRHGRTRSWAEHTAWAAVSMLAGREADWLGSTQASRLRRQLRAVSEVDELLTRMRDRAAVRTFAAHRSALPRLRERVAVGNTRVLGVVDMVDEHLDGYLSSDDLDEVVSTLRLLPDPEGAVTLRTTGFDFDQVKNLVSTPVVAALDTATSVDPRLRGVGRRTLSDLLTSFR